nr:hypothetical protein [Seinonella peptonophila]
MEYYIEIDQKRFETRKVETYQNQEFCYTSEEIELGTYLSPLPTPTLEELEEDEEIEVVRITKEEFEKVWKLATFDDTTKKRTMWSNNF